MQNKNSFRFITIFTIIAILLAFPLSAGATHAWGDYHWERSSNPVTLNVIDNMTPDWDGNLDTALSDWNKSSVLNLVKEAGNDDARTRKRCGAVKGKLASCNYEYGTNGWLGLAQIWVKGSHITQGTAKMNDSYLASGYTETNKQHVICQEIGHLFGLTHQDESGADLNTCMDYSSALDNPHPNQHDYDMLDIIYEHLDSSGGGGGGNHGGGPPGGRLNGFENANVNAQENWGAIVSESANGRSALYVRDFGNGYKIFTFVFWAE